MTMLRYTFIKAPFGAVYFYADHNRLVRIDVRHTFQTNAVYSDSCVLFDRIKASVGQYLKGDVTYIPFSLPGDMPSFPKAVYSAVQRIPYGKTATSAALAAKLGTPTAVRAIEELCISNPFHIVIPCHRVLLSSASLNKSTAPISIAETLRRLEKRCIDKVRERR